MPEASHVVAIGLGSNLGDRQANIAGALQRLRSFVTIEGLSSAYQTKPVGFANQPDFLNLACVGRTTLEPRELRDALRKIEREIGRRQTMPLGPRAIDLDLLLYDDLVVRDDDVRIPHDGLTTRAFVLVPLAEIAAELRDPVTGKTIRELAAAVNPSGVQRFEDGLLTRIRRDVQEARPAVPLALDRAGVTGVKALVDLPGAVDLSRPSADQPPSPQASSIVTFDIFADLDARRSGVHMSRFSQDIEDVLAELAREQRRNIDEFALAVAERVVESQGAERAEVDARTEIAIGRYTPVSAIRTNEFYTLLARAVVARGHRRRMIGVEVEGITACPCAQAMVADYSRERLLSEGFDEDQIAKILSTIPVASHNQRAKGTLWIGAEARVSVATLVEIVEQSMSAETYDLLKRPDELFVVNKAHFAPRFVEDVVREMFRYAHDALEDFPDDTFIHARQVNAESIHKHDAVAESSMTLGELRRELRGDAGVVHTRLEDWLYPKALERSTQVDGRLKPTVPET